MGVRRFLHGSATSSAIADHLCMVVAKLSENGSSDHVEQCYHHSDHLTVGFDIT